LPTEFTHLITFNQKDLRRGVSEETWLNEARADYTSTLLGYDNSYKGSNLEERVRDFLASPNDSLTEWLNNQADYGVANLFTQYLVDQYGLRILSDSMKSDKVGIPSINDALRMNSIPEDFNAIFSNWIVAALVNDCSYGSRYCYKNPGLKNFRVTPRINYLPPSSAVTLTVTYYTTYYAATGKIWADREICCLSLPAARARIFPLPYLICFWEAMSAS